MTPDNFGSLDTDRMTAFIERRVGGLDLAADLSYRNKTVKSLAVFSTGPSALEYDSKQTQFSPRARQLSTIGGMLNEVVAGVDVIEWNRKTVSKFSQADATQHSKALYVRDEVRFDAEHEGRLAAGARRELFDKDFSDPSGFPITGYHTVQGLNAWELQASYAPVAKFDVYAKIGQSYRVANADENAYSPLSNAALLPQVSHDVELGASYGGADRKITVRVFRHNLSNEIFFNPTLNSGYGYNTNLDPTKRQGFEVDAEARVAADWNLTGHYQHVNATFTEGVNSGKQMVLVPKNLLTVRLGWAANGQSADVGAQWVGSQRDGGDFINVCGRMPAFTTVDGRYARKIGAWELALTGANLGDKHYYSQAYSYQCEGGIYPADGRQLKVSARYDF
jgi:iron complex outermembrane receptor protein